MRPGPARAAADRAVAAELHHDGALGHGRDVEPVVDQLVAARRLGGADRGRHRRRRQRQRRVAEGRGDQPVVGVEEHLVHADLVQFAGAREPGVEDQEVLPGARVEVGRVVPRRDVAQRRSGLSGRQAPLVAAHQLLAMRRDAGVVEQRARGALDGGHVGAASIQVRAIGIARARHPQVVATVGVQPAEAAEQVVVLRGRAVEHIGALDAGVVAAHQVLAVALARERQAGGLIELQDEEPARVRAVDHPEPTGGVLEDVRIDHVGMHRGVVDRAVLAGQAPLAGLQQDLLVHVGPGDRVRDRHAQRRTRRVALAGAVVHAELAVVEPRDIGRPQVGHLRPGEGVGQRRRDLVEQRVGVVDAVGDRRPVHQVGGLRRREVRAEHEEAAVHADHRRIVHRDLGERDRGLRRSGRGCWSRRRGRSRSRSRSRRGTRRRCRADVDAGRPATTTAASGQDERCRAALREQGASVEGAHAQPSSATTTMDLGGSGRLSAPSFACAS